MKTIYKRQMSGFEDLTFMASGPDVPDEISPFQNNQRGSDRSRRRVARRSQCS